MDLVYRVMVAVLVSGFALHRGFYARKIKHPAEMVVYEAKPGRATRFASLLALAALLSTLIYVILPRWLSWSMLPLPAWVRWLGLATAVGGFALLQWAQHSLGQHWSDQARLVQGHQLVTSGPYRWIRHPIYAAFLLILGSLLLISANWLVGGLWIAMTSLDVALRMAIEESIMVAQFGESYGAYQRRTGRLVPRLWSGLRDRS